MAAFFQRMIGWIALIGMIALLGFVSDLAHADDEPHEGWLAAWCFDLKDARVAAKHGGDRDRRAYVRFILDLRTSCVDTRIMRMPMETARYEELVAVIPGRVENMEIWRGVRPEVNDLPIYSWRGSLKAVEEEV